MIVIWLYGLNQNKNGQSTVKRNTHLITLRMNEINYKANMLQMKALNLTYSTVIIVKSERKQEWARSRTDKADLNRSPGGKRGWGRNRREGFSKRASKVLCLESQYSWVGQTLKRAKDKWAAPPGPGTQQKQKGEAGIPTDGSEAKGAAFPRWLDADHQNSSRCSIPRRGVPSSMRVSQVVAEVC